MSWWTDAAIDGIEDAARKDERRRIAEWLRSGDFEYGNTLEQLANAIESGAHEGAA